MDDSEQGLLEPQNDGKRSRLMPRLVAGIFAVSLLISVSWATKGVATAKDSGATMTMATIALSANSLPKYDTAWKELIAGTSCPAETPLTPKDDAMDGGNITCEKTDDGGRHFKFPAGEFEIDEQVAVPAGTMIEGNANPNDPSDKAQKPVPLNQTFFIATTGVSDFGATYCGTNNNMQQGHAQTLRIGFLLNSDTTVKHINFQGQDTTRPHDNGNLCGGGAFETPGCVSPGYSDGVGTGQEGKRYGCYDHKGNSNSLITGDGKGVQNVLIDSVRVNDYWRKSDPAEYGKTGQASQVAVWVAMTNDGSPTQIKVKNLVSMLTRGDGINFHGNVQNSVIEDCHIENTGDDIYAFWGAYAENPSGNVFRNNVGVNPGMTRDYKYGVCVAIYGVKELTVTGNKCYDLRSPGTGCCSPDHCNSCLAMVHGGWFGAIYPQGNKINISGNDYFYMDERTKHIPQSDRPMVRTARADGVNIIGWN